LPYSFCNYLRPADAIHEDEAAEAVEGSRAGRVPWAGAGHASHNRRAKIIAARRIPSEDAGTRVRDLPSRDRTRLRWHREAEPRRYTTPNLVERGVAEAGIDQSLQRCLAISSGTEGRALTLKIFWQMAISVSRRTSPLRGSVPTSRLARAGVGLGGPSGRAPAFAAPGEVGRSMLSSLHG